MNKIKEHKTKKWIISIIELQNKKYKVTRRIPEMSVAETKIFDSFDDAEIQFNNWLKY